MIGSSHLDRSADDHWLLLNHLHLIESLLLCHLAGDQGSHYVSIESSALLLLRALRDEGALGLLEGCEPPRTLLILVGTRELGGRLRGGLCVIAVGGVAEMEVEELSQLVILEVSKNCNLCSGATILVPDVVGVQLELLESRVALAHVRGLTVEEVVGSGKSPD